MYNIDLIWYKKTKEGKWEVCSVPPYKTDISQQTKKYSKS